MGMPIFACILGAALLGLSSEEVSFSAIPIEIFRLSRACSYLTATTKSYKRVTPVRRGCSSTIYGKPAFPSASRRAPIT